MTRLEGLTPGARVRGLLPDQTVEVVQVEWHGSNALTLTYRDGGGRPDNQILYRGDEARLLVEAAGRAWSLDADGDLFRLVSEARRISLAYLFDPFLAVQTSDLDPLPHHSTYGRYRSGEAMASGGASSLSEAAPGSSCRAGRRAA